MATTTVIIEGKQLVPDGWDVFCLIITATATIRGPQFVVATESATDEELGALVLALYER